MAESKRHSLESTKAVLRCDSSIVLDFVVDLNFQYLLLASKEGKSVELANTSTNLSMFEVRYKSR